MCLASEFSIRNSLAQQCIEVWYVGFSCRLNPLNTLLLLAVQGAMPSAQNLVLLAQLRRGTQPLAPRMAALLLRLYTFAIVPVTLWMTLFAYNLPASAAAALL